MTTTLLLRLAGPLQSWGTRSRFEIRETQDFPSRSGVLGLLCAALGRDRSAALDDLNALRLGVRVDREGVPLRDFHTAQGVLKANQSPHRRLNAMNVVELERYLRSRKTTISHRHYLADAVFLVGLEGDAGLLGQLAQSLRSPRWPLYLGRKSCVPSPPVFLPNGLRDASLETALRSYPLLTSLRRRDRTDGLRVVLEVDQFGSAISDRPISFAERVFGVRKVEFDTIPMPPEPEAACT